MSPRTANDFQTDGQNPSTESDLPLFSADSHVIEKPDLWADLLPAGYWPDDGKIFSEHPGGHDPVARLDEMKVDGVSGEVLYPSLALKLFSLEDADLQSLCFRRYNEWLAEYCATAPERLIGVGMIPAYDIDRAVEEVKWCRSNGLCGCLVWQSPPENLSFRSTHYEKLWAVCAEMDMPVSLHILTGFDYSRGLHAGIGVGDYKGLEVYRGATNLKVLVVSDALFDLIFSGALDRHRKLKLAVVENEIGWLPFLVDQWDYYCRRLATQVPIELSRLPSECFEAQIFITFFRDQIGTKLLGEWGINNCMWSNDFPHGNSTWPNSRDVVAETLKHVNADDLYKLIRGNVLKLYKRQGE